MAGSLKCCFFSVVALLALGAIAHGAEFHCSVVPCRFTTRPDGTGKEAHHVFIIENETRSESIGFTCEQVTGAATNPHPPTTELTLSEIVYDGCKSGGIAEATIATNGCTYLLKSNGEMHLTCPAGKKLELRALNCVISIGEQWLSGVSYTTIGTTPSREITLSFNVAGIALTVSKACGFNPEHIFVGTYTTGNTILTGESEAGVMADAWFG